MVSLCFCFKSRCINRILISIFISVIIGGIITSVKKYGKNIHFKYESETPVEKNLQYTHQPCQCNNCCITCENISAKNNLLNMHVRCTNCTSNISAKFINITFENSTLENGWLSSLQYELDKLELNSVNIETLGKSCFSGTPFTNLTILNIENTNISYLQKNSFHGSTITTFQFRSNSNCLKVERGVFNHIRKTLKTIQFARCICDPKSIYNISGFNSQKLSSLTTVDLRYNYFGKIINNSFFKTQQLAALHLSNNNLSEVEPAAFNQLGVALLNLELSNNYLQTLPEGVFESFNRSNGKINITNNIWRCDCDMNWFKYFYEKYNQSYFSNIIFECWVDSQQIPYLDVDFCPNKSTTERPYNEKKVKIICEEAVSDILFDEKLLLEKQKLLQGTLTFYEITCQNKVYYELKFEVNNLSTYNLLYIQGNNKKTGCKTNLRNSVLLKNLTQGQSYTICLIEKSKSDVNPLNCASITTPKPWEQRPFWKIKDKPVVIASLIAGLMLAISITSFGVFFIIRQNPNLIKGNKRVIIINYKDVLLMPRRNHSSLNGTNSYISFAEFNSGLQRRSVSTISEYICNYRYLNNILPLPPNYPFENKAKVNKDHLLY